MKKHIIWAFVALTVAFASCKPDPADDPTGDSNPNAELIVGLWNMDVTNSTNHDILVTPDGTSEDEYSVLESGILNQSYEFHADGSLLVRCGLGQGENYEDNYTYSVKGDTLVIDGVPSEVYRIDQLDQHSLVLSGDGSIVDGNNRYSYYVHYIFER